MWSCSKCGSQCDADFCATCGNPREANSSRVRPATGHTPAKFADSSSRIMDIVVAVLMIVGIIILLFAPVVIGADFTSTNNYNIQKLYNWISDIKDRGLSLYLGGSSIESSFSAVLFAISIMILLLYTSAAIMIVNFFKRIPRLFNVVRWIPLGVGVGLLILLIYFQSALKGASDSFLDMLIQFIVDIKYFGVICGILFTGTATLLQAIPVRIGSMKEEPDPLSWRCSNPSCGNVNSGLSLSCSRCGTRKDGSTVSWICSDPSCGHANSGLGMYCDKCGARKGATIVKTPTPNSWNCANGHTNTSDSLFCSVCGSGKPIVANGGSTSSDTYGEKSPSPGPKEYVRSEWTCNCGQVNTGRDCTGCGVEKDSDDTGNRPGRRGSYLSYPTSGYIRTEGSGELGKNPHTVDDRPVTSFATGELKSKVRIGKPTEPSHEPDPLFKRLDAKDI